LNIKPCVAAVFKRISGAPFPFYGSSSDYNDHLAAEVVNNTQTAIYSAL